MAREYHVALVSLNSSFSTAPQRRQHCLSPYYSLCHMQLIIHPFIARFVLLREQSRTRSAPPPQGFGAAPAPNFVCNCRGTSRTGLLAGQKPGAMWKKFGFSEPGPALAQLGGEGAGRSGAAGTRAGGPGL